MSVLLVESCSAEQVGQTLADGKDALAGAGLPPHDEVAATQDLEMLGQTLVQAGHSAGVELQEKLESLTVAREGLEKAWTERRGQLDQCLQLQLFYRWRFQCKLIPSVSNDLTMSRFNE